MPGKDSAAVLYRNILHSRDVRPCRDAPITFQEKCPDKFWVE